MAILVMADYECSPLWWRVEAGRGEAGRGEARVGNIDPGHLPISAALADALQRWADDFDRTLNHDDPAASGFADQAAEDDFVARGAVLAHRLAEEHRTAEIRYFDLRTGRDEPVTPKRSDREGLADR
jgi:hypothetical protein